LQDPGTPSDHSLLRLVIGRGLQAGAGSSAAAEGSLDGMYSRSRRSSQAGRRTNAQSRTAENRADQAFFVLLELGCYDLLGILRLLARFLLEALCQI